MPRHVTDVSFSADDLAAELSRELANPQQRIQPIILEDFTAETKSRRVRVIWDRWIEIEPVVRTIVILQAYEQAFDKRHREQVKLAIGLTSSEAQSIGLLPFEVVPAQVNGNEPREPEQYWKTMFDLGAFTRPDSPRPQLRFAKLEDAQSAYLRLLELLPTSR